MESQGRHSCRPPRESNEKPTLSSRRTSGNTEDSARRGCRRPRLDFLRGERRFGRSAGRHECRPDGSDAPRRRYTFSPKGSLVSHLPVAAAMAFATAAATGATPGSPTPVGFALDATICVSTFGISSKRSTR